MSWDPRTWFRREEAAEPVFQHAPPGMVYCRVRTVVYAGGREATAHTVCKKQSGPLDLTDAVVVKDTGHWIPKE